MALKMEVTAVRQAVPEEDHRMLDEERQEFRGEVGVAFVEAPVVPCRQNEGVGFGDVAVDVVGLGDALRVAEQQLVLADVGA
jgi:hypothetical protein